jgi:hypothetical protein
MLGVMNFNLPNRLPSLASTVATTFAVAASHTVFAQTFDFTALPSSTVQQNLTLNTPLAGTLIGNYNATTNPTGTRTLPGYFGGSGNQSIPYTSTVRITQSISSNPAGTFSLSLLGEGACTISGLTSDLLNGAPGTIDLQAVLSYSTFRTVNPSSLFPYLGPVTIPFGSGSLDTATAVQSGPAVGTAKETSPGTFSINVPVPVEFAISGSVAGQVIDSGPLPSALALVGTLTVSGSNASFTVSANENFAVGPVSSLPPLQNLPLPLPTISGGTANLLVSGNFGEVTGTASLTLSLAASGVRQPHPADINGDGSVDSADLAVVLGAWGSDLVAADVNRDGTVDSVDLAIVIGAWS